MAIQVTNQPTVDPLALQGGAPAAPAVPSIQPPPGVGAIQPAGGAANILQPAAPAPAAAPKPVADPYQPAATSIPQQTSQPINGGTSVPPISQPAKTFSLGNGKTYDQSGNEIDQNGNVATGAGLAGLSATDFLNLLNSQTATNTSTYKQIQDNLGIPQTVIPAFAPPQQPTVDFYNQAYSSAGLGELKQKISDYNQQIADTCVCQLDLAPFDTLIWPHLGLVTPAGADASV